MVRRSVLAPLVLVLGMLLVQAAPGGSVASPSTADYIVFGVSATDLAARGLTVLDAYGPFTTARLTSAQATILRAEGRAVEPLDHRTGRGDYVGDFAGGSGAIPAALRAPTDGEYVLVQFRGPVKPNWGATLAATAITVYDYLPHDAYLARVTPAGQATLRAMAEVRDVEPWHPAFKLSPLLPDTGPSQALVVAWRDTPLDLVLAQLETAGASPTRSVTTTREHVILVSADASAFDDVARLASVALVEADPGVPELDNALSSAITQGGAVGAWPLHARGVDGSTQLASVCDTGTNTQTGAGSPQPPQFAIREMTHEMHDDPADGRLQYNAHAAPLPEDLPPHRKIDLYYSPQEPPGVFRGDSDDGGGHGTHTSGTIAGDAPPYGVRNGNDGVAYAAKLLICDIETQGVFHLLLDYSNYWQPAYERGARVNSNSWGSPNPNALRTLGNPYQLSARQHDDYVWSHRDFVITRSMGNTGPNGAMRPEATAKSILSIGATFNGDTAGSISPSSTHGYSDGRVKPNVVAPGNCLTSSYVPNADSYHCVSGTSMSTPTVAGAATLIRDYFAKGFYPSGNANPADARSPSAALVRGLLQASATEIPGDGWSGFPNEVQGWGRVLLDDGLYFAGDARRLLLVDETVALATGDVYERRVTVEAGQPLRIMLAWSDYPGVPLVAPLVNDLDLEVEGPDGLRLGNAFVGSEVPPGQGTRDFLNVEEAVYVTAPAAGTYTLRVRATDVGMETQPFALVATGGTSWATEGSLKIGVR